MVLRYLLVRLIAEDLRRFVKYIFILLLLTSFQEVNAQFRLIMEMAVTDGGKKMPGAEIKVYKNGSLVETVLTDAKGLADIACDPNAIYTIEIGGNKGKVKKKLEVNTKNVAPEGAKGDVFFPATVELFEKIEGMDLSILDKPIGKIRYDDSYGDFDSDAVYTKSVQKQLAALEKDFLSKQAAEEARKAGAMKTYAAAIKIADKAFAAEEWEKAAEQYKIAEKVNPDPLETYPSFQLAELKTKLIKIEKDNKQYNAAISKAEAAVASKDYEIAIAEYKRASGYKPKEELPKTKIKEVQSILANSAKVEQSYLAAIEKGDNALKINDIKMAKTAFAEALSLKSDEAYPKNKIAEIDDILAKQEAKKAEYENAIKAGNDALAAKDYPTAKSSYQTASGLRPGEQYPKDQIGKVDALIAGAAKLEQNYLAAIEKGDNALKANNYQEANTGFQAASKLKPEEAYPKDKMKEIAEFIAKNAAAEKQYTDKIAEADKALAAKDYEGAKTAYNEAKSLKPSEAYPQTKLTEIDGILAKLAKAEESYKAAIAKGDKAVSADDFETAKAAFTEALTYKPDEQYPKDKLAEIETIVLKNQKSEEEYKTAIQDGDDALSDKNYEKAKEFFTKASGLKPEEAYPKDKIAEIEKTVAEAQEKEKSYNDALAAADDAMNANEFEKAKASYEKASGLKPDESYPKEQITKIVAKLAESQKLEADYLAVIKEGDEAFGAKNYEVAKAAFTKATTIKGEEEYPKGKITEIDAILAELKGKEEQYNSAITKGDAALSAEDYEGAKTAYNEALAVKEDDYPKTKISEIEAKLKELIEAAAANEKLEADYQAAITDADKLAGESKYDEAIAAYTKASGLKPEEAYPKGKITELTAAKENAAKEAELAETQKQYDEKIKAADALFDGGDLEAAKSEYQAALGIKADETYPQERIASIEKTLADSATEDANYKAAISAADKLAVESKWEEAKTKYTEAAGIKPDQEFPKEKIVEMDERIAEMLAQQEEIRLQNEKQTEIDANYQAAIAEADGLFNSEKFAEAKPIYETALALKAEEQYPKDKIVEIGLKLSSLAEQQAAVEAQAKVDAEYEAIIVEADGLFGSNDFEAAKTKYQAAIAIKDEQYPKDKLVEIDAKIAALAGEEAEAAAAEAQAKIDAEYNALIAEADGSFGSNDFEVAKTKYQAAIAIKDEQYPKDKLVEIDAKIAALAGEEAEAAAAEAQAKIDAEYNALIAEADGSFGSNDFEVAKTKYQAAIAVKDEQYPKDKLVEIDAKIAALAGEEAEAAAAEAQAKIDAEYNALIAEADGLFNANDFESSKVKYQAAIAVKDEQYPKDKLAEIDVKVTELAGAEADAAAAEAQAKIDGEYDAFIIEADGFFSTADFEQAKVSYQNALGIKDEQYPKDQMALIDSKIAELADAAAAKAAADQEAKIDNEYNALIAEADASFERNEFQPAKASYEAALGLKDDDYPKEQINKIGAAIEALANEQAVAAKAAKLDQDYLAAVEKGDQALSSNELENALTAFNSAIQLKPGETYPVNKIAEINNLIAERSAADAAKQEELNKIYDGYMQEGQIAIDAKDYGTAVKKFQDAQNTLPGEVLPSLKIKEIKDLRDQMAAKEDEIRLRKEQAAANESSYQTAIANGDKYITDKNYNDAENEYRLAKSLKPDEQYPNDQLDKIRAVLDAENAAKQAVLNAKREAAQKEQRYKDLVARGSEQFQAESYKSAKKSFESALRIKPNESYPKSQIALLIDLIKQQDEIEAQRRRDLDKPIQIQTGPKATITDDAEAEIERIYKELWAKQNSNKNAVLEDQDALISSMNEQHKETEEKRRKNAIEQLEEISISVRDQLEATSELNLQNYETIKEQEEDLYNSDENLIRKSERRRGDDMIDRDLLAESIAIYNQRRMDETVEGKKIMVENEYDEVIVSEQGRIERQYDRLHGNNKGFEELEKELLDFHKGRSTEFYPENYKQILEDEQVFNDKSVDDNASSATRRLDYQEESNDTEVQLRQFTGENSESFKNNQLEIEEIEEDLKEVTEGLESESEKRRKKNEEEEFYVGEKKERQDQSAADYPQGVTEEIIENQNNSTTIKRIVVEGTTTDVYEKTLYKWGGIFYTKNGTNITKDIWDKESK